MHYATATRGRWLVAIGSIVIVGSTMLQWWSIGGGYQEMSQVGEVGISDGPVYLMFLMAMASLLLVTLPFASEKSIPIDHPVVYLGLLALAIFAYVWRVVLLAQLLRVPWPPTRGWGFWLAAAGLILLARGVFEVFEERRRRLY